MGKGIENKRGEGIGRGDGEGREGRGWRKRKRRERKTGIWNEINEVKPEKTI